MDINLFLEKIPLLYLYFITAAAVFLSIMIGYRVGIYVQNRRKITKDAKLGSIIGAMLGLLAFILAFTFGAATSRFDDKKQLLLDEVNAIGTTFLRTDFLAQPERADARKLLKKYVDLRVNILKNPKQLPQVIIESEKIQSMLWSQVSSVSNKQSDPVLLSLYIQSLNDVIDLHTKRVTVGLQYRIPGNIWMTLYFVTILTMLAVGYEFGLNGAGSNLISLILALAFSAFILLIADLDRGVAGTLRVSQKPLIELQQKLNNSLDK
ncbi:MAG TPA: hypothetical protein VF870_11005 [Ignavibacteriaceae bacterium]